VCGSKLKVQVLVGVVGVKFGVVGKGGGVRVSPFGVEGEEGVDDGFRCRYA